MGDREAIGRTIATGSGLSVAVGVAVAALFYVYSSFLLRLMGAPEEVMGLAVPYLRWRASAFPANLFVLTASGAFRWACLVCTVLWMEIFRLSLSVSCGDV